MLGSAAILDALTAGPLLVVDLATGLGLPVPLVEASLHRLRAHGAVESFQDRRHVTRWRAVEQRNPSGAAGAVE